MENNRIEKQIELNAPVSRVWRAITDHRQFGAWFKVNIDGPFVPGQPSTGHITHPGYEHVKWDATVQKIEPEHLFSFTWHPYSVEPDIDYSKETPTLVEFKLEPMDGGTRLTVIESGFENVPPDRRALAFRMNEGGWGGQVKNIKAYVEKNPE